LKEFKSGGKPHFLTSELIVVERLRLNYYTFAG
jgi:hypothetical protein